MSPQKDWVMALRINPNLLNNNRPLFFKKPMEVLGKSYTNPSTSLGADDKQLN